MSGFMDNDVIAKVRMKPSFIQSLAHHLRVFESLGTATSVQRKHDALLTMQWLYVLRHTPGEVVEATLLVDICAEMACPHLHRPVDCGLTVHNLLILPTLDVALVLW